LKTTYTDSDIIEALQTDKKPEPALWEFLYQQAGKPVLHFVQRNSGSKEDAEDVLQEGLRRMIVNVRNGEFNEKSTIKTYLFSICRNIWIGRLRRIHKWQEIQTILTSPSTLSTAQQVEEKDRSELLQKALGNISKQCQSVLTLWTLGYSMKEIAQQTGYKNAQVAKKKKHICLEKLIISVKNRPALLQELMNHL